MKFIDGVTGFHLSKVTLQMKVTVCENVSLGEQMLKNISPKRSPYFSTTWARELLGTSWVMPGLSEIGPRAYE